MSHTRGPWLVDRREDHDINAVDILHIGADGCVRVAAVIREDAQPLDDEDKANARLIASAPALADALHQLVALGPHPTSTAIKYAADVLALAGYA